MENNYDKQIEKIWADNPKIPFMQSKEILRLGYQYGIKESKGTTANNEANNTKKSKEYVGTAKELINTAKELVKETKDIIDTPNNNNEFNDITYENTETRVKNQRLKSHRYVETTHRDIEGQLKIDIINRTLQLIDKKRDLIEVYIELQTERDNIRNQYGL